MPQGTGASKGYWDLTFKFVDLFAGLGGFHVALSKLGGEAVFAAEWVTALQALYETNHGLKPHGDINTIDPEDIPSHDVLAAGFPCQPFSKAGEQLGFQHTEQGHLFFKVLKILDKKRPNYFILENVPNILKHGQGETIATIQESLELLNYTVKIARFSPHEFGVPQIRDRVYIVGSQLDMEDFTWPTPSREPTDIRTVLDRNPSGARKLSSETLRCLEVWDRFLRACPKDLELPSFPIWAMEFGATYPYEEETPHAVQSDIGVSGLSAFKGSFGMPLSSARSCEEQLRLLPSHGRRKDRKFPKWKIDFIRQNREFYEQNRSWIDPILPDIETFPSSMQKFEWNAKGEEKSIWNFVIQFRASGVRVKRSRTAPSLVAMTDTQVPIIGWEKRYMTPRECSRLQSLESLELPESRPAAYKALGNAVNATVVRAILANLLQSGATKGDVETSIVGPVVLQEQVLIAS